MTRGKPAAVVGKPAAVQVGVDDAVLVAEVTTFGVAAVERHGGRRLWNGSVVRRVAGADGTRTTSLGRGVRTSAVIDGKLMGWTNTGLAVLD